MFKKMIVNIFVILNLLCFSVPAAEQNTPAPALSVYKISDSLYSGSQPDANGFAELKNIGIKTIVNLRDNYSDVEMLKGLGLKYINIPVDPWKIEERDVVTFLKVVTDPDNQPVYVHCQHGLDKTGTMTAIYRMYALNWTDEKAAKQLPKYGFQKLWENLKVYLKTIDLKKLESQIKELSDVKIEVVK